MGLMGRNTLFLIASLLIIIAMAQPVIINSKPIEGKELHIIIAIDRGEDDFEKTRSLALSTLMTFSGEEIELIAFDNELYRIAPRSNDSGILSELIKHLSPSQHLSNKPRLEEKLLLSNADLKVVITPEIINNEAILNVSNTADVVKIEEILNELRGLHRTQAHIPLFFYPLGAAMVLILFALSSMSKRRSVSVGSLFLALSVLPDGSDAAIFDFKELSDAKTAYEMGEYPKSERIYARYQLQHDSPQVRYNRANALYMCGQYKRAQYWYERVYTTDPVLKKRVSHNLKMSLEKIQMTEFKKTEGKKGENGITLKTALPSEMKKSLKRETPLFAW